MWRKVTFSVLLMGMQTGAPTVENSMEFPQKKNENGTAFGPSGFTAGNKPQGPESPIQKTVCTPMFVAVLFTIAKIWHSLCAHQ